LIITNIGWLARDHICYELCGVHSTCIYVTTVKTILISHRYDILFDLDLSRWHGPKSSFDAPIPVWELILKKNPREFTGGNPEMEPLIKAPSFPPLPSVLLLWATAIQRESSHGV
jgi:hypothetical protein